VAKFPNIKSFTSTMTIAKMEMQIIFPCPLRLKLPIKRPTQAMREKMKLYSGLSSLLFPSTIKRLASAGDKLEFLSALSNSDKVWERYELLRFFLLWAILKSTEYRSKK